MAESIFCAGYQRWLHDEMGFQGYDRLFDVLYNTEFVYLVPMDANRESDGKHLRTWYEDVSGITIPANALDYPCSFLEMLVALAMSMDNIVYFPDSPNNAATWLWLMLDNIGIGDCDDEWFMRTSDPTMYVLSRIDAVMLRRYSYNGEGGIFPLMEPMSDQRDLELWYQMNSYILENQLV